MTNAELIAGLAGPVMMAVAIAMLINRQTVVTLLKGIGNDHGFIFFAGILTLLAGLAIVRAHNVWSAEWTVLITIVGWLAVIAGIVRIIWPDRIARINTSAMGTENAITAWALVALMLGAFLTAKGYALV